MIYHLRSAAHLEESPVVMAFRKKMASEEARKQYRRRGRIVEFCHAWIKSSLRQFHVRGLKKSADGNAVGLSHLQPAALDPIEQAPHNNSDHPR